jgi:hypothetical protein
LQNFLSETRGSRNSKPRDGAPTWAWRVASAMEVRISGDRADGLMTGVRQDDAGNPAAHSPAPARRLPLQNFWSETRGSRNSKPRDGAPTWAWRVASAMEVRISGDRADGLMTGVRQIDGGNPAAHSPAPCAEAAVPDLCPWVGAEREALGIQSRAIAPTWAIVPSIAQRAPVRTPKYIQNPEWRTPFEVKACERRGAPGPPGARRSPCRPRVLPRWFRRW